MTKTNINKINKIMLKFFPEIKEFYLSDEFQSLLSKALKKPKIKSEKSNVVKTYTAYIKFCMYIRPKIVAAFPHLPAPLITREIAKEWCRMKEEDPEFLIKEFGWSGKK
jgi:hypothetical protein